MLCIFSFAQEFISTVTLPPLPFFSLTSTKPSLFSSVVNIPAGFFAVHRFDAAAALEEAAGRAAKAQADAEASLKKAEVASSNLT